MGGREEKMEGFNPYLWLRMNSRWPAPCMGKMFDRRVSKFGETDKKG